MRFNSVIYWLFLALAVVVLWLLPPRARRWWLLVCSLAFYASWHWPYVFLLLGVGTFTHYGAAWVAQATDRRRRGAMIIAGNLLILGLFKYLDWLVSMIDGASDWLGLGSIPLPGWVLPLGISFYVFECVSYVVDVVRKRERPHGYWDFQLYLSFFPHLIAGPILRAKELLPQIEKAIEPVTARFRDGLWLLGSGLFLKLVLADGIAPGVDEAFARAPRGLGATDVAVMGAAFGIQIYLDFASYSRMALGSAKLCGIDLVDNFDHPYVARNPADFWARWHISLSRWIRDYLFYPLVGGRATLWALCRAAIVSMVLCGLWHGAGWTFVLWGLYHGLLIAGFHVLTHGRRTAPRPTSTPTVSQAIAGRVRGAAAVVLTFGFVSLGWILFRSTSVEQAFTLVSHVLTPWAHSHRALPGTFYLHTAALVAAVWAAPSLGRLGAAALQWGSGARPLPSFTVAAGRGVLLGGMIALAILYLHGQTAFIYFQF